MLFACSPPPYRVVEMENGQYVVQQNIGFVVFETLWVNYYDASKCYRFDTMFEATEACSLLIKEHEENRRARTGKKVLK